MDLVTYAVLNKKVEEAKNVSDEKISGSVNAYLDKNPPTTGATPEQAAQIDKNVADIGKLKGDIADKLDYKNPQELTAEQQSAIQSAIGILSVEEVLF